MRTLSTGTCATAALLLAAATPAASQGRVCPDPARPCAGFRAHDLSFVLPAGGPVRPEHRSAPFYAVLLRSSAPCAIPEAERAAAQAAFPRSKVFSARFECGGDVENNVTYTAVDPRVGFLAVYAGETRAAALAFLERVRATGRFPGANLRRMRVVRVTP